MEVSILFFHGVGKLFLTEPGSLNILSSLQIGSFCWRRRPYIVFEFRIIDILIKFNSYMTIYIYGITNSHLIIHINIIKQYNL